MAIILLAGVGAAMEPQTSAEVAPAIASHWIQSQWQADTNEVESANAAAATQEEKQAERSKLIAEMNAAAMARIARIRAENNRRQLQLTQSRELKNFGIFAGVMLIGVGSAGLMREWKRRQAALALQTANGEPATEMHRKPGLTKARYLKLKKQKAKLEYQREMQALIEEARREEMRYLQEEAS